MPQEERYRSKEYLHLDDMVTIQKAENGIFLKNGDATLCVYSDKEFLQTEGVISKKYNELLNAPLLIKEDTFTNRSTSNILLAGEEFSVKKAEVFQVGKTEAVSQDFVTAWDIELEGKLQWTLLIWNRETYRGGKMYLCHDIPVYGKAIAMRWDDDKCQRIRLKN